MYTFHNIPGTQYVEYVDPGNLLLYSFVFTGSRVDDATPKKYVHDLFGPVFAYIIVIVIDVLGVLAR